MVHVQDREGYPYGYDSLGPSKSTHQDGNRHKRNVLGEMSVKDKG